jgi:uncharacterized protein (DUF1501 family)
LTRRGLFGKAAAIGLTAILPRAARASGADAGAAKRSRFLLLWLEGGPSQLETWDPHPGGKHDAGLRAIATKTPGLHFSELYPSTAERSDRLSVIRSLVSSEGDHERAALLAKTGQKSIGTFRHPSLGAIVAGALRRESDPLPPHISLVSSRWPARGGFLGEELDAFRIERPGQAIDNLRPGVDRERFTRRKDALAIFSRAFAPGREAAAERHAKTLERALTMMDAEELSAFELDSEPAEVRAAYGESAFGRGCLVARRLLERGVPAIEVTLSGFDSHASNAEAHKKNPAILDPALARLVDDLSARELWKDTVLLVLGEFGRTPKINAFDGRDHWPHGFSCLLAGGGIAPGRVIGETDPGGESKSPKDPVPMADLAATVLAALSLDPSEENWVDGRPIKRSSGAVRKELLR